MLSIVTFKAVKLHCDGKGEAPRNLANTDAAHHPVDAWSRLNRSKEMDCAGQSVRIESGNDISKENPNLLAGAAGGDGSGRAPCVLV